MTNHRPKLPQHSGHRRELTLYDAPSQQRTTFAAPRNSMSNEDIKRYPEGISKCQLLLPLQTPSDSPEYALKWCETWATGSAEGAQHCQASRKYPAFRRLQTPLSAKFILAQ
jgi:hypothetical protein